MFMTLFILKMVLEYSTWHTSRAHATIHKQKHLHNSHWESANKKRLSKGTLWVSFQSVRPASGTGGFRFNLKPHGTVETRGGGKLVGEPNMGRGSQGK